MKQTKGVNQFTIKDIENLSGIKAHTIRIWEQRYSFVKPSRTDTNIRYYSSTQLKKLMNIALLNKYGFRISHIDKMTDTQIREKILLLNQPSAQHEKKFNDLLECLLDLNMLRFEEILDMAIAENGIGYTVTEMIFPFLERTGILWLTNHINPAQEHLVSNLIRQKLIAGIDSLTPKRKTRKRILLFLPEGEYHELGLLFVHYILKAAGWQIIYIGASVPLDDLLATISVTAPDYLYTHITLSNQNRRFSKFLLALTQKKKNIPLIVSGKITACLPAAPAANLIPKDSLAAVRQFIGSV